MLLNSSTPKLLICIALFPLLSACTKDDTNNEPPVIPPPPKTFQYLLKGEHSGTCYRWIKRFDFMLNKHVETRDTIQNSVLILTPTVGKQPLVKGALTPEGCGTGNWIPPIRVFLNETDSLYKWSFHVSSETWFFNLNTNQKTIHTRHEKILSYGGFEFEDRYYKYD